jgi:CRISPR/Cas system endoribonuclease Cas6 (RAMP superfamily)
VCLWIFCLQPQSKSNASADAERLLKFLAQKEAEKLRVNRTPRLPVSRGLDITWVPSHGAQ